MAGHQLQFQPTGGIQTRENLTERVQRFEKSKRCESQKNENILLGFGRYLDLSYCAFDKEAFRGDKQIYIYIHTTQKVFGRLRA